MHLGQAGQGRGRGGVLLEKGLRKEVGRLVQLAPLGWAKGYLFKDEETQAQRRKAT